MLKDKRIHQSKIWQIMERRKDGKPLEFSIQFCKKSNGELVTYDRAAEAQSMYYPVEKLPPKRFAGALSPNSIISKYISNETAKTATGTS